MRAHGRTAHARERAGNRAEDASTRDDGNELDFNDQRQTTGRVQGKGQQFFGANSMARQQPDDPGQAVQPFEAAAPAEQQWRLPTTRGPTRQYAGSLFASGRSSGDISRDAGSWQST